MSTKEAIALAPAHEIDPVALARAKEVDRSLLKGLTGRQKAAIFLISMGSERAADILRHLTEREVEALSSEMAGMWKVKADTTHAVIADLAEQFQSKAAFALGGPEFARDVLTQLVGETRADEIVGALVAQAELRPFDFLRRTPPEQIVTFLSDEAPQTVALVVACLQTSLAATVLADLPSELQAQVALRIATMTETNPGVIEDVERGLRMKLSSIVNQGEFSSAGGIDSLAEILNRAGRSTERNVLTAVQEHSAELADEIRQKLFTFDDIVILSDRDIQLVLREVDQKDLGLALRGVDGPVRERIFANMSSRGGEMLREDLESGQPQRRAVVEEAQGRIVGAVRRLEEGGAITIGRGTDDPDEEVI